MSAKQWLKLQCPHKSNFKLFSWKRLINFPSTETANSGESEVRKINIPHFASLDQYLINKCLRGFSMQIYWFSKRMILRIMHAFFVNNFCDREKRQFPVFIHPQFLVTLFGVYLSGGQFYCVPTRISW